AAERGAQVTLVSTAQHPAHPGVRVVAVETAADMEAALRQELSGADLLVMAAAVADFRPAGRRPQKIRREESEHLTLELEKIPDLVAQLAGEPFAEGVFRVGFAAESADLEGRAREKLERKGLDAILANDITRRDIAFGSEYNQGLLFFRGGDSVELPRTTKRAMADRLLDLVRPRLK
ncbi:MAG TPA: phosphopantothenoylcysteine decarboxylase, partial [Candidatus Acidoferrales bacterium]|nr:phosphopantothenoylcysteine decarboxylase [Candidatus Acidoferrales bacterium]